MVIDSAARQSGTASLASLTLVLGGARSGKSRHAEALVAAHGPGLYLATAEAGDAEMAARIREHRVRRGPTWHTLEEPLELAAALAREARPDRAILVDCLTLWLSNLMHHGHNVAGAQRQLLNVLPSLRGPVVFVSNEVGSGIVPDNALARRFRDAAGLLNQEVAAACQRVILVTAGLPLVLKG